MQQRKHDLSLPEYLNVSNRIFQKMFLTVTEYAIGTGKHEIIRC
jgi:hypothetical protein